MSLSDTKDVAPVDRSQPAVRPLLYAALFMVVGLSILVYIGREESRLRGQSVEELDIQPLMNAEQAQKIEELKGKVVVLHFWGPWCPPCVMEYPGFAKLQQQYLANAQDVVFLSIASQGKSPENKEELVAEVTEFFQSNDIASHPVFWDPAEYSRAKVSVLLKGRGFGYPTTILLDKDGKIGDVWQSVVEMETLQASIEKFRK